MMREPREASREVMTVREAAAAKAAQRNLRRMDRRAVVHGMADALAAHAAGILAANEQDLRDAMDLDATMLDRLRLDRHRIDALLGSMRAIAEMQDPVDRVLEQRTLQNGLYLQRRSVPLGVIGMIYESRPDVTADAAAMCIRAGSAVLLKGGSEAIATNTAMVGAIREGLMRAGIGRDAGHLVQLVGRERLPAMLASSEIDLMVPRGSERLIALVRRRSRAPVLASGGGNCHIYVHEDADMAKAIRIIVNAKTQRPGVCNAVETVLVHQRVAREFLPLLQHELYELRGIVLRGCARCQRIITCEAAAAADWRTEYLAPILALRVIPSMAQAMRHIERYGTGHSEAIITEDKEAQDLFLRDVDAAVVYANASTRFTDGGQFGMGAELGISTQKVHCRGPIGLDALVSSKWEVHGDGQVRA